jgi:hypothetical protein
VSNQQPIFNGDLLGKANRIVMNDLVQNSAYINRNKSAIDWAQRAIQPENFEIAYFLAVLKGFQLMQANRWRYSFRRAVLEIQPTGIWYDDVLDAEDESAAAYEAINLYEFPNTGTATQDGDLNTPPMTVGPVGATYDGTNWSFASPSTALVVMYKQYTKDGTIKYFFSHPNPVRCIEEEPPP